jgi:hypothetical protein
MSWERIEQPLLVTYFSGVRRGELPRWSAGGFGGMGLEGAVTLATNRWSPVHMSADRAQHRHVLRNR